MDFNMKERFEKLPSVAKYLKFVFWNSETKGYCNNSGNPVPLDFATFINGAWYVYQEQEKRIDEIVSIVREADLSDGDSSVAIVHDEIQELLK